MRTTDFDRIASSSPLDANAAIARDGSGEHYEPLRRQPLANHWEDPPVCEPLPAGKVDLAGRAFGRMRVVRYFGANNGSLWLCRCSCGRYETRRTKSIIKEHKGEPMCQECDHIRHLKDLQIALRTGKWPTGNPVDQKMFAGMKTANGHLRLRDGYITDAEGKPLNR